MEINKIIGQRINSLLAEKCINQKDLAKELGVQDNIVSYWCNGKRKPNIEQIIQMSRFFDVSADYLLGLTIASTSDKDLQFICDYTGLTNRTVGTLNYMKNRDLKKSITIDDNGTNVFIGADEWIFFLRNIEKIIRYSPTIYAFSKYKHRLFDSIKYKKMVDNGEEVNSLEERNIQENIDISLYLIQKSMIDVFEKYGAGIYEKFFYEKDYAYLVDLYEEQEKYRLGKTTEDYENEIQESIDAQEWYREEFENG